MTAERLLQENSFAKLTTPLGSDVLVLSTLHVVEGLSTLYEITADCILNSEEDPIDPNDIIGKAIGIGVADPTRKTRYFHGIVTEVRLMGVHGEHLRYRLVARPWTWLLTRQSDCKVFQEKTVDAIIREVFDDLGFSDFNINLQKSYPTLEHCVQYEETHYDFIARLMEKYGIYFFFKSENNKHTMIITDNSNVEPEMPTPTTVQFRHQTESGYDLENSVLIGWSPTDRLRTAKAEVMGFNYQKAATAMNPMGSTPNAPGHSAHAALQTYHTRLGFDDTGDGQLLADIGTEIERADARVTETMGFAPLLAAGMHFTPEGLDDDAENVEHYVVQAEHWIAVLHNTGEPPAEGVWAIDRPLSEWVGGPEGSFARFTLSKSDKQFKAPRSTPLPRIYGPQTAWVIAQSSASEEIDVDDEGRILVKFHWNRQARNKTAKDSESQHSCRVRVAQLWAHNQWGSVWVPRVGMEVVVEFIDGDPDRPIVTGCVYNSVNKPPVKFPKDKTVSGIVSRSSKSGGAANANFFKFDDKKGSELFDVQAEKDMTRLVKNDDTLEVENDQTITVKKNRTEEVSEGNETVEIKQGNRTVTIGQGNEKLQVKMGNMTTLVDKGNVVETIKMGKLTTTLNMGAQTTTLKMGNQTNKMNLGKHLTQAMQSIELKVGGSSIKIDMMGVTIKGPMIKIEASAMLQAKGGAMAKVEGGGMLMLKGGVAMIN